MPVTYKAIATVTVSTATAANIEFTSIPGTYTDLCLVSSPRCDSAGSAGGRTLNATFNSSTSGYSYVRVLGTETGASSTSVTSQTSAVVGRVATSSQTANAFPSNVAYIPNYTSSNNKSFSLDAVLESNDVTNFNLQFHAGLWADTAAITSITLTPASGNFVQYSTATLYGILKA